MKKKVLFLIYTEYQLILSLNEITKIEYSSFEITFLIKRNHDTGRLVQDLDLSLLNVVYFFWDHKISFSTPANTIVKESINNLLNANYNRVCYFQEQDPLVVILSSYYNNKKAEVWLFQDGLKPYNKMKSPSLGQMKGDIKQNRWIKKSGFKVFDYFSFFKCHKYGFLKGTQKLFLTFPESYDNWNNKIIEKIELKKSDELIEKLKLVFKWDGELFTQKKNVIFFVSQSMRDDNTFEQMLLDYLLVKYSNSHFYLKSHPTNFPLYRKFIENLKTSQYSNRITILDTKMPAELFIMQLEDSIIISTISTSMFLDNPNCRFYYTHEMSKPYIPRFKRYDTINPTPHTKTVYSFEEII